MVRVGVTYIYESLHKRRNAGVCVCVCVMAGLTSPSLSMFFGTSWLVASPAPRAVSARALSLSLRSDLHEKKKEKAFPFFFPPFSQFGYGKRQHFFLPYLVIKSSASQQ